MNYADLLTISGGPKEITEHIRRKRFGLIVSANNPVNTHEILPTDIDGIEHHQSHVFSIALIKQNEQQGLEAIQIQIVRAFLDTSKAIEAKLKANQNVLVHCRQGYHRSPAIAMAAMIYMGTSTEEAMRMIYQIRAPEYNPDSAAMGDVMLFQRHLDLKEDASEVYERHHKVRFVAGALAKIMQQKEVEDVATAIQMLSDEDIKSAEGLIEPGYMNAHLEQAKKDAPILCGPTLSELVKKAMGPS